MKFETERLENRQMALTIEVDEERTQQALRSAARRISRQAKIPGFRPGKAPYNVVVSMFGKETLYQEVVDELGQVVYKEALEETGIEPFAQAQLMDFETDPLVLKMIVPLAPVVELGDYRQTRLEPEETVAGEEEVNEALKRIQDGNSIWEPVNRPAQWNDLARVDIEGTVEEETVMANEGREIVLRADSRYPLPGFNEQLVGMTADEQREFTLTYPEESENKHLAGQPAHFKVRLHGLKEKIVPEIDDDLARAVGNFETLDDLKAEVRRELQEEAKGEFTSRALAALVERARIEFPPVMLAQEIDDWLEEFDQTLRQQGLNLQNYLAMRKLTEEELRQEVSPQVEERLKRSLALAELAKQENLAVESFGILGDALERLTAIARGELEGEPTPEGPAPAEEPESTDQQPIESESEERSETL